MRSELYHSFRIYLITSRNFLLSNDKNGIFHDFLQYYSSIFLYFMCILYINFLHCYFSASKRSPKENKMNKTLQTLLIDQTSPILFKRNSHPVNVNALNTVVSMTTPDVTVPSCPIFFAMT